MLQLSEASAAMHCNWLQCAVNSPAMTRAVQNNEPVVMWLTQTHKSLSLLHQLSRIWLQQWICFSAKFHVWANVGVLLFLACYCQFLLQCIFTEKKNIIFSVWAAMKALCVDYLGLLPEMIIEFTKVYPCEMKLSWIKGRDVPCTNFLHFLEELQIWKNKKILKGSASHI